ncbi:MULTISPECIES: TRAP transporter small permease [Brevibacillus]|uniref:Tripartite AtP-independent periplasmic transporter subunit DctQ n=1 Tax=Brevibacillus borstelensis AK1 TaxID=1300222 RepID=M8DM12_9BACL|nr:TRAP transporter small permease [Brevibacillus borstelensis]EMT54648.1 tripartite AtP-independent periplasmic transporter subunit DctQ [Brevibacillus borstelensis AK1]KKX54264.1 TRAP C4-dicarboxylate transporter [Brevibacillus borstelensis cifa_chp40]MBE5396522.1 TRAP transporter small permease [Brevibacillus borstelensis]MCC0566410.1 TRAP transporter small permease [Brevibacillus borstelensis]MCM3471766.1 TRAP transporter small permease [Brevibacillus borstelensis]
MQAIVKAIDGVNKVLRYAIALLLAVMTALIVYQVVARLLSGYINIDIPRWTEELARYAMIWLVLIGTSLAVRYSALIGVEAIAERLPAHLQKVLRIIVLLVSMVFFVVLIVYGFQMLAHVGKQLSPGLKIPMTIPYASLPIGGVFMLLNSIAVLIEVVTGKMNREFFKGAE